MGRERSKKMTMVMAFKKDDSIFFKKIGKLGNTFDSEWV